MDQSFAQELLRGAVGDIPILPTPEELSRLLADAEVASFFGSHESIPTSLIDTAWLLHQVGTVRPSLGIVELPRQIQANQVAAHILDLVLLRNRPAFGERLVLSFAAQVSSIRGDRSPNAGAIARRLPIPEASIRRSPGRASLELGCTFLGLNRGATARLLDRLRSEINEFGQSSDLGVLSAAVAVVSGVGQLMNYLTYGIATDLEAARGTFELAANNVAALADIDSRWVAAHLLDLCDDLGNSSIWQLLPPNTPPEVGRCMTLGDPPVLTLWPPQVELLTQVTGNMVSADVKRSVIAFPTSAGKTLLMQLFAAHHLSTRQRGVCVVAPSHSLCREIRRGMEDRLWPLGGGRDPGAVGNDGIANVDVITPEQFSLRVRTRFSETLDEYGLFIFDEAHLISDRDRGWQLEAAISQLHVATGETDHRIYLVSAAMSGTMAIQTWLNSEGVGAYSHASWRAPRRMYASYHPTEDPHSRRIRPAFGQEKFDRTVTDLHGVMRVIGDGGERLAERSIPLGEVVRFGKSKVQPRWEEQLLPAVRMAAATGPVMTFHATRRAAEKMAAVAASELGNAVGDEQLVRLAEVRLGAEHPLVEVLKNGVAYHHAALPMDIQSEIERAVRDGGIRVICSTSTLTDGVNLPVRTVIVCDTGYWDGTRFLSNYTSLDLMNAAGRAGRAGRETEGWVVFVGQRGGTTPKAMIESLGDQMLVTSTLAASLALKELSEYERLLQDTESLVLSAVPPLVDRFLSYCWFVVDLAESTRIDSSRDELFMSFSRTLAWQQMNDNLRARWLSIAERVRSEYVAASVDRRRRWARSGGGLSANAVLDRIAESFNDSLQEIEFLEFATPYELTDILLDDKRMSEISGLTTQKANSFKKNRFGPTVIVSVDIKSIIMDWVNGTDLPDIAKSHLSIIDNEDDSYKFEQLSNFITYFCEHHLPWIAGELVDSLHDSLNFPAATVWSQCIRYGVPNSIALSLMASGVRSRRLAVAAAKAFQDSEVAFSSIRSWLINLGLEGWREQLGASSLELADILNFVRDRRSRISARLLDGETCNAAVSFLVPGAQEEANLTIEFDDSNNEPHPIVVMAENGKRIGSIQSSEFYGLALLLREGFQLDAKLIRDDDRVDWAQIRVRNEEW